MSSLEAVESKLRKLELALESDLRTLVSGIKIEDELLAGMYRLPHTAVPPLQDSNNCELYSKILTWCLSPIWKANPNWCTPEEYRIICGCKTFLDDGQDDCVIDVRYHGEYGCAILICKSEYQLYGSVFVKVLGLDEYTFNMHSGTPTGHQALGVPSGYQILDVGQIEESALECLFEDFDRFLSNAKQHTGNKRSTAGGRQGHQFTPAFIHAILLQVKNCSCAPQGGKCSCSEQLPTGGFTDNGKHTGGEPRNTSFPLTMSILQWKLEQHGAPDNLLFKKIEIFIGLRVARNILNHTVADFDKNLVDADKVNSIRLHLDWAKEIIEISSIAAAKAHYDDGSVEHFLPDACNMNEQIKTSTEKLATHEMSKYVLPDVQQTFQDPNAFYDPILKVSKYAVKREKEISSTKVQRRLKANIGLFPILKDPRNMDICSLRDWVVASTKQNESTSNTWVILKGIERYLWHQVELDFENNTIPTLTILDALDEVVHLYYTTLHEFRGSLVGKYERLTEIKSREVLVFWIAYCLVFATVKKIFPDVMEGVGVGLDFNWLGQLVLSDKYSWETACKVAKYLAKHKAEDRNGLFSLESLASQETTFLVAERYSAFYDLKRLEEERRNDELRVNKRWNQVLAKKEKVSTLYKEYASLNDELDIANAEVDDATSQWERRDCINNCKRLRREMQNIQYEISEHAKAPTPICQPLPKTLSKAQRFLFFYHMPKVFRVLSDLTLTCQQLLLPCELSKETMPWLMPFTICQDDAHIYYNKQQETCYLMSELKGSDGYVHLRSVESIEQIKPRPIGSKSVVNCENRNDGVWYPDNLTPRIAWTGGRHTWHHLGGEINPFLVPKEVVISTFTEKLCSNDDSLQWALRGPWENHSDRARGNFAYARQYNKPSWMSKDNCLAFCGFRDLPHRQLRNLAACLSDGLLPLENDTIQCLMYQSLFQLGSLLADSEGNITMGWKRDIFMGNFLESMLPILDHVTSDFKESPQNSNAAAFVAEMCNFFSEFDESFKSLSRSLASSFLTWAIDIHKDAMHASGDDLLILRSRQCVLLYQSIQSLSTGKMSRCDCKNVIKTLVMAQNVCLENAPKETLDVVEKLQFHCWRNIAQCLSSMQQAVMEDTCILTDAIQEILDNIQDDLQWTSIPTDGGDSTCFQARADDGNVFALNFLTGIVLVNGLPPRSLPAEVREHPLYKRVFGRTNFEVVVTNHELFKVQRRVNGMLYEFFLSAEGELYVAEIDTDGHRFELIDGRLEHSDDTVTKHLPIRLRMMHSHWINRGKGIVLLRGIHFDSTDISFFLELDKRNWATIVRARCKCVPRHLQSEDWKDLVHRSSEMNCLVLHSSALNTTLEKFEERRYIHFIQDAVDPRKVTIDMPRLSLSFVSNSTGVLRCQELADLHLARNQQLDSILYGFSQYLVLEHPKTREITLVLINGRVQWIKPYVTNMCFSDQFDANLSWTRLKVHHRFNRLQVDTLCSRLRLASLHLSTACKIPEKMTNMTGDESAILLLRQCWSSRPFSQEESVTIRDTWSLCEGVFPSVSLACIDLLQNSEQMSFLYKSSHIISSKFNDSHDDDKSHTDRIAYSLNVRGRPLKERIRLTEHEEMRVLGHRLNPCKVRMRFNYREKNESAPFCSLDVDKMEKSVLKLISTEHITKNDKLEAFPLSIGAISNELQNDLEKELKTSWNAHSEVSRFQHVYKWSEVQTKLANLTYEVEIARLQMEQFLLQQLSQYYVPEAGHIRSVACAFLQIANCIPLATSADLVSSVYYPHKLNTLNPSLSMKEISALKTHILVWMRLCRLEDKNRRIQGHVYLKHDTDFVNEINSYSPWDVCEYPFWLAFEVEGALQIRSNQLVIARHLIENPSHIAQLNMGSGKTRVILPMLILNWTFNSNIYEKVSRLNILSALFGEAYEFFHLHLTASIAQVKVFTLPFNRDIAVDARVIGDIRRVYYQCVCEKGFFIVAPEHRLSLHLKSCELAIAGHSKLYEKLCKIIRISNWRDILDESDELLHHRFQLIYAIGDVDELPGGLSRYQAAHAVLERLLSDRVKNWIQNNPFVLIQESDKPGAFPKIRVTKKLFSGVFLSELRHVLAYAIVTNPPYELDWLKRHKLQKEIISFLADPTETSNSLSDIPDEQLDDICAIRGYLASDILFSCLQKTHRVNYGVDRKSTRKRICVPFRGADTPSLRSEFSHPDCTICLTTLSYYYDGLNESEVKQTFDMILSLGQSAKRAHYAQWLELSKPHMENDNPTLYKELDRVEKLDLSNRAQFKNLMTYFSFNFRTVSFWLNSCVFPEEMQQYPQRLSANSWHLAENAVGFSGTNDNHRILPKLVKQFFPKIQPLSLTSRYEDFVWQESLGTNGKMVGVIIDHTIKCMEFEPGSGFKSIIETIEERKNVHAVIDSGAVLVGLDNAVVAQKIIETVGSRFQGVLFPDNSMEPVEWKILEHSGRILPKALSPVLDHNAFAIFDEPRCRGSDLKLSNDAVAIITLGTGMCKDKFMQAAGRMRKLGRGQRLIILGSSDLMKEVHEGVVTPKEVLEWTIRNTATSNTASIVPWANQGLFYCTTRGKPEKSISDENNSLRDNYSGSFDHVPISEAVSIAKVYHMKHGGWDFSPGNNFTQLVDSIMLQSQRFGSPLVRTVVGMDEECERELELEREVEEEDEIEIPSMKAFEETSEWDISVALQCRSINDIPSIAGVMSIADFLRDHVEPKSLLKIKWSGHVMGTKNFFRTVTNSDGSVPAIMNHYLRPIKEFIQFRSGEILLISEREADMLLCAIWEMPTTPNPDNSLHHLSFSRIAADESIKGFIDSAFSARKHLRHIRPRKKLLTEMQLFAGETTFKQRCPLLKEMLELKEGCRFGTVGQGSLVVPYQVTHKPDGNSSIALQSIAAMSAYESKSQEELRYEDYSRMTASGEPLHILSMRGRLSNFAYSDLEGVCKNVAQEAGEGFVGHS